MTGPWLVTLECGHRYQLGPGRTPDLALPIKCGQTRPGHDKADGLQMIVAAITALEEAAGHHNRLAAERKAVLARAARIRATQNRRADYARQTQTEESTV